MRHLCFVIVIGMLLFGAGCTPISSTNEALNNPTEQDLLGMLMLVMLITLIPLYLWISEAIGWARKRFGRKPRPEGGEG